MGAETMTDAYTYYVNEKECKEDMIEDNINAIEKAFYRELSEMVRTKNRIMEIAKRRGVEMYMEDVFRELLEL